MLEPAGEIDLIRGIVSGTPFDTAVDRERIVGEATDRLLSRRTDESVD